MVGIKLHDFTCKGKCSCCGQCCSDLLSLSKEEINRIDDYLLSHKVEAIPKRGDIDLICPFRNDTLKVCMIYEARPDICRVFKCDRSPKDALAIREFTNFNKKTISMRDIFFKDTENKEILKKIFNAKIWSRNDVYR